VQAVLVEIPEVEAAQGVAQALFEAELSDTALEECNRLRLRLTDLRKRELDLRERLGQMAAEQADAERAAQAEQAKGGASQGSPQQV
jgi:uncharacterized membrane protein